jgi:GNAT superfamily N-acetyltransferase
METQEDQVPAEGRPQPLAAAPPAPEMVTLRDGSQVTLRPVRPDDAARLQALHGRLSPQSIFFRFLGHQHELSDREAQRLANVDYDRQMAWVATPAPDPEGEIIGVARYAMPAGAGAGEEASRTAEAAVVVQDRWQRRGLGTLLLQRLVDYARPRGITLFQATVHQANTQILRFIRRSGLRMESEFDGGVWEIRVSLEEDGTPGP